MKKVSTRNAAFQQWEALLTNRTKRQRLGEFLVQGVRPISLAVEHGWEIRTLLHAGRARSRWADELLSRYEHVQLSDELLRELGGKEEQELIAVVGLRPDRLDRIPDRSDLLVVVFDRPATPGNIGNLIRSADAFGAHGVIVTGHAADPYDPRSIRASTGSLFAIPVIRAPGPREVLAHFAPTVDQRGRVLLPADDRLDGATSGIRVGSGGAGSDGRGPTDLGSGGARVDGVGPRGGGVQGGVTFVATDEQGETEVAEADLKGATVVLIGNETNGLAAAWREAADVTVRIPITGAASSLNAATAGTVVLYEAARQRRG